MEDFEWDTCGTGDLDEEDDGSFYSVKNITTNFVLLTLLLRCSEVGLLFGARTNYRLCSSQGLTGKTKLSDSMVESAYKEGSDKRFNNTALGVMFYSLVKASQRDLLAPRLGSIAKEDFMVGTSEAGVGPVEVHLTQATAVHVTEKEYSKLAFIMNLKTRQLPPDKEEKRLFDFKKLLAVDHDDKITSLKMLKKYVHGTMKWDFFQFKKDLPLACELWRVRSFFQVLTGVGITVLEGSHRMTLAAKLMTGIELDRQLPADVMTSHLDTHLPAYSKLYDTVSVDVMSPKTMVQKEPNMPDYLTPDSVEACRKWSEEVAYSKLHFIQATWRDWVEGTLEAIHGLTGTDSLDELEFLNMKATAHIHPDDRYLLMLNHVSSCVADALLTKMPAKLVAQNARRILQKEDRDTGDQNMDPDEFRTAVVTGKCASYVHNCFYRVSAHTAFSLLIGSIKRTVELIRVVNTRFTGNAWLHIQSEKNRNKNVAAAPILERPNAVNLPCIIYLASNHQRRPKSTRGVRSKR